MRLTEGRGSEERKGEKEEGDRGARGWGVDSTALATSERRGSSSQSAARCVHTYHSYIISITWHKDSVQADRAFKEIRCESQCVCVSAGEAWDTARVPAGTAAS